MEQQLAPRTVHLFNATTHTILGFMVEKALVLRGLLSRPNESSKSTKNGFFHDYKQLQSKRTCLQALNVLSLSKTRRVSKFNFALSFLKKVYCH